jgi:hypothetical protein
VDYSFLSLSGSIEYFIFHGAETEIVFSGVQCQGKAGTILCIAIEGVRQIDTPIFQRIFARFREISWPEAIGGLLPEFNQLVCPCIQIRVFLAVELTRGWVCIFILL